MNDSFGLGDPITGRRRPASVAPLLVIRVAIEIAIATPLWGAAIVVMKRGGEAVAEANERAVETVDRANDVQAQASLQAASRAALVGPGETGTPVRGNSGAP